MPISAAQEASLLEISQEQIEPQAHPDDQSFQGREPPVVQNVVLQPQAMSTPATAAPVPATPWRAGIQLEINNVQQRMSQAMDARYDAMQNLVAQSQAETQSNMQASMEAMFKQYLGALQAPIARPQASASLGAPPVQPTQAAGV